MLAGLISLGACHVVNALRARATECGWPELFGQAIDHAGDAAGLLCMCLVGCAALVLCAVTAEWFWIANTLYAGAALSAVIDTVARVIVYRTGMP